MLSIAKSPLAPILGQRVPLRGPARMLFNSCARTWVRLAALDRLLEPPAKGGNFLAVSGAIDARISSLL